MDFCFNWSLNIRRLIFIYSPTTTSPTTTTTPAVIAIKFNYDYLTPK